MNSANNTNDLIWYMTEAEWWDTHYGDGNSYGYGDGDGYGDGYGYGDGDGYNGNGILIYRRKICK